MVGRLGRKRPSPLTRGDLGIWAAGVVYVVGQLILVFGWQWTPYATTDQLSGRLGVKKTTMAVKARLICDTLALSHFAGEFMRRDLVEADPLTWLLEVDGLLVDIRHPSAHIQVRARDRTTRGPILELTLSRFSGVDGDGARRPSPIRW